MCGCFILLLSGLLTDEVIRQAELSQGQKSVHSNYAELGMKGKLYNHKQFPVCHAVVSQIKIEVISVPITKNNLTMLNKVK